MISTQFDFGEKFIVLNELNVDNDHCEQITLKRNTVLSFFHRYGTDDNSYELRFYLEDDINQNAQIIVPGTLINGNIKKLFEYYQEKFNYLDPEQSYFGQLSSGSTFSIEENPKTFYFKIDDYTNSEGIVINAFKLQSQDTYWSIDDQETYSDKEFIHFELDKKIRSNSWLRNKNIVPPKTITVPEYFVNFPQMLEIVELLFKQKPLTAELQKVYDEYQDFKRNKSEYDQYAKYPITSIFGLAQEKNKEDEYRKIMDKIEIEVQKFRSALIKKMLNC